MSLLKNPSELKDDIRLSGLFYGQPGVGKSTLALSAPKPVLIDADNGMRRVLKRFQVPSLPLTNYADLLALLESPELDPFDTIVIDTLGRLIERIGDHVAAENPTYRQKDGSLSLKGFGKLKIEFQRLLRLATDHKKHLIFVAHDREERDGDTRIIRPDTGPGASGKELVKDLDFMGYMEMSGPDRTISFSPCERYYAKNALGLDVMSATMMTDPAADADDEENQRYNELMVNIDRTIGDVEDAQSATMALEFVRAAPVIWDSQRVARHRLNERIKDLGLVYDRARQAFIAAAREEELESVDGQ